MPKNVADSSQAAGTILTKIATLLFGAGLFRNRRKTGGWAHKFSHLQVLALKGSPTLLLGTFSSKVERAF